MKIYSLYITYITTVQIKVSMAADIIFLAPTVITSCQ